MTIHPHEILTGPQIPSFRPDGSVLDLAAIQVEDIVFAEMAAGLSKIARFNGRYRCPAYSVAQHSVMGADALMNETGDAVLAGYFLLHDGHEYLLGDLPTPTAELLERKVRAVLNRLGLSDIPEGLVRAALQAAKAETDKAIFTAAGLPGFDAMPLYARAVKAMEARMQRAEAVALFGKDAACHAGGADLPAPRLTGAIKPWGAMKAEEAFVDRLERYLGIVARGA